MRQRKGIAVGFILTLAVLFSSPTVHAATVNAASCSAADVSSAINSATSGDTVAVPAGSCTWTSIVTLPNTKAINLIGAGALSTHITIGAGGFLNAFCSTGKPHRISGLEIIIGGNGLQMVKISGACAYTRFDHNTMSMNNSSYSGSDGLVVDSCLQGTGSVYAVVDHNTFQSTAGNFRALEIVGPICSGSPPTEWPPSTLGTANNTFIEDNTFNFHDNNNQGAGVIDANYGATYVFRHNTVTNSSVKAHAICNAEGVPSKEIYGNTLIANSLYTWTNGERLIHEQGSGEFIAFNNRFTALSHGAGAIAILHYRSADPALAGCSLLPRCAGTVAQDGNRSPTGTYYGYPCYHQPGRKRLLTLSPIYLWDNLWSDDSSVVSLLREDPWGGTPTILNHIQPERDYYDYVQAAFSGTTGTGMGTLANRPATCTTNNAESGGGVGYWATDTQTLYRCAAANTWVAHYRPYTYPHPATQALPSPANLRVM